MRPRLNALTTLRFFAALHVVLFHVRVVGILSGGPWWYQNFASIGFVGVNFFFVLSGFILVYTYDGPQLDAPKFWRARFARIYPAYALSLIVAAPFFFFAVRNLDLPFFAWSKAHFIPACVLTLALLQSWVPQAALTWNSVCWSLSVEALFYFVFPFFFAPQRQTLRKESAPLAGRILVDQHLPLFRLYPFSSGRRRQNQFQRNQSVLEKCPQLQSAGSSA